MDTEIMKSKTTDTIYALSFAILQVIYYITSFSPINTFSVKKKHVQSNKTRKILIFIFIIMYFILFFSWEHPLQINVVIKNQATKYANIYESL